MQESSWMIVFKGEFQDGVDPAGAMRKMGKKFGLSEEKQLKLMQRRRTVLKRNLSRDAAQTLRASLGRLGLLTYIEPFGADAPSKAPAANRAPAPAVADAPKPAPAAAPSTTPAKRTQELTLKPFTVPPPPSTLPPDDDDDAKDDENAIREIDFEFNGSGSEFFRIWIVNLLLTILTLGIFSAWAKVRSKRYFYGNTSVAGSSFEYLANPVSILKGRLIILAVIAACFAIDAIDRVIGAIIFSLLFFAVPWAIARAVAFRNHNSSWRGVRFGFDGSILHAYFCFFLLPLISPFTLGLIWPAAIQQQQKYIMNNARYGRGKVVFDAAIMDYYFFFLKLIAFAIAVSVAFFVASLLFSFLATFIMLLGMTFIQSFYTVGMTNLRLNNTSLEQHSLRGEYELGSYFGMQVVNMLGMIFTLGLFYPWARVRMSQYAADHTILVAHGSLDHFVGVQQKYVPATGDAFADFFDIGF